MTNKPEAWLKVGFVVILLGLVSIGEVIPASLKAQGRCGEESNTLPTIESGSQSPAALTSYTVTFEAPRDLGLGALDSIDMVLHEDIGVPGNIVPTGVRLHYCTADGLLRHLIATYGVSVSGRDPRRHTTITIFPGVVKRGKPIAIPKEARVTIMFRKQAGLSNPTEGGTYRWTVATTHDGHTTSPLETSLTVNREIDLSHKKAGRGTAITVIGRGYKNGLTLTVWRDSNMNGLRDLHEPQLCQTLVRPSDIGYCEFTLQYPLFARGHGECEGPDPDCNYVNAVDGVGISATGPIEEGNLELVSSIRVHSVLWVGRSMSLELIDFPQGVIETIDIGGVPVELNDHRVGTTGRLFLNVTAPNQTRLGRQYLRVRLKDGHEDGIIVNVMTYALVRVHTPEVPPTPVPKSRLPSVAEEFVDLGDRMLRVAHFDNVAKRWSHHVPGEGSYGLRSVIDGQVYVIMVRSTTVAKLNGRYRLLTCARGNCWNQIVW